MLFQLWTSNKHIKRKWEKADGFTSKKIYMMRKKAAPAHEWMAEKRICGKALANFSTCFFNAVYSLWCAQWVEEKRNSVALHAHFEV